MHLSPLIAFVCWLPVPIFFFHRYAPRVAILASLFGGWAILPGANYVYSSDAFPYWVLGVCLPSNYLITKATVISVAVMVAWLIFRAGDIRQYRLAACDLPITLWCCIPLLSVGMHAGWQQGALAALYQTLAWGVPWLLGRLYFYDRQSLLLFAKACVIAGAAYVPVCLLEWFTGPQLYHLIYGYQPFRYIGANRYIGWRPIGFLEDGNQLGIWMAASALLAAALAWHRFAPYLLRIRAHHMAWILGIITFLCQSAGSILLYLLLLPFTFLKRRTSARAIVVAITSACIFGVLIVVIERGSLRYVVQGNHFLGAIAYSLQAVGRRSFAWRLARDASHMAVALHKPIFGYGAWDWWRTGDARPWSLWLLTFGMYGIVGLSACMALFAMPVFRTVLSSAWDNDSTQFQLRVALTGLIIMVALDNLLNGAFLLPYLLAMAGMSSPSMAPPSTKTTKKSEEQRPTPLLRSA